MNNKPTESEILRAEHRTLDGAAAELLRVDAIANILLASVGRNGERYSSPSQKLELYVALKTAELRADNLDMGDAMEVIGAVANVIKMFNGVI